MRLLVQLSEMPSAGIHARLPTAPAQPTLGLAWNMMEANRNVGANWPMREGDFDVGWGNAAIDTSQLRRGGRGGGGGWAGGRVRALEGGSRGAGVDRQEQESKGGGLQCAFKHRSCNPARPAAWPAAPAPLQHTLCVSLRKGCVACEVPDNLPLHRHLQRQLQQRRESGSFERSSGRQVSCANAIASLAHGRVTAAPWALPPPVLTCMYVLGCWYLPLNHCTLELV